jgi:hypothetical protein
MRMVRVRAFNKLGVYLRRLVSASRAGPGWKTVWHTSLRKTLRETVADQMPNPASLRVGSTEINTPPICRVTKSNPCLGEFLRLGLSMIGCSAVKQEAV